MPDIRFKTYGEQNCADGHSWGPGVQPNFVLQYVVKGRGFFESGGKRYELLAGQCFFIEAGSPVYYYPDMRDPWVYRWVSFYGADARQTLSMTALFEAPVTPPLELCDIFDAFSKDAVNPAVRIKNEGLLYLLLSKIITAYPAPSLKTEPDYLHIAKKYISANLHRSDFNVSALASAIGVERSYLFRLFKAGEGVSVIDYIVSARLESARAMLDGGITQIKVVAASCGYDNPLYFSNAFKKRFGMSPKHYMEGK